MDAPISSEPLVLWDFNQMVGAIIQRRQANPRFNLTTDVGQVQAEVDLQNAMRMRTINGGGFYIVEDANLPNPPDFPQGFSTPQRGRRSAAGGKASQLKAGVGLLIEWLGEGGQAVDVAVAESRANICASCPKNQPGDWLSIFTEPAAEALRKQIAIKNDMELRTSKDDELNVCQACLCVLRLKVWCPSELVQKRTSQETREKLDPRCWILSESK